MKKNYYTIHKNKKPKKLTRKKFNPLTALTVVSAAMGAMRINSIVSQPIPRYKNGLDGCFDTLRHKVAQLSESVIESALAMLKLTRSQQLTRFKSTGSYGRSKILKTIRDYEKIYADIKSELLTLPKDNEVIQDQKGDFKVVPPFKYASLIKANWKNTDSIKLPSPPYHTGIVHNCMAGNYTQVGTGLNLDRKKELNPPYENKERVPINSIPGFLKNDFDHFFFGKTLMKEGKTLYAYPHDISQFYLRMAEKAEIKQKVASLWEETELGFKLDNLIISVPKNNGSWLVKDTSSCPSTVIGPIHLPLSDRDLSFIKRQCSVHHKCPD